MTYASRCTRWPAAATICGPFVVWAWLLLIIVKLLVYPAEPDLVTADDALGVDGEQHFDAVPGPLGHLGRRDTCVEA
jgi:hypothetical protein